MDEGEEAIAQDGRGLLSVVIFSVLLLYKLCGAATWTGFSPARLH